MKKEKPNSKTVGWHGLALLALAFTLTFVRVSFVYAISSCNSASDISASGAFTCTFSDSNTTELDGKLLTTVDWNPGTLTLHITIADLGLPSGVSILGIDAFGFNSSGLSITTPLPASWTVHGGPCPAMDGFHSGATGFDDCDGNPATGNQLAVFDLILTGSTATSFDGSTSGKGAHFAEHVKLSTSAGVCTAFFGDANIDTKPLGTDGDTCKAGGDDTGGGQETGTVPEPSSLILLGSGLLVFARAARKKLN